ncbi:uncharacterized protein VTP21DRAFT_2992 [Calcarisporiella thermophila]|uniref:uncharacterized protein n=1 Tax=Calcarisporiella thermophila TaxID=911321 RepID=UPI003742A1FE
MEGNGTDTRPENRTLYGAGEAENHEMGSNLELVDELGKLSLNIDELTQKLQDEVVKNYDMLQNQVAGMHQLESALTEIKGGVKSLSLSLERIRNKVRVPYEQIRIYSIQLERLQTASETLRCVIRFLYLVKRLQRQLPGDTRDLAKAALSLREIEKILQESDLSGINAVEQELPMLTRSRADIANHADNLLNQGLTEKNQAQISTGLQVFYNLNELQGKVQSVVDAITEYLASQMKACFDISSLHKQVKDTGTTFTSGIRRINNEPTAGTAALWTAALWPRIEKLIDEMADGCIRIYTLERVLSRIRDPITHIAYLEEVSKAMDGSMAHYFWKELSANFEEALREATDASSFLLNTLISGYPKLLRLMQDFFTRVSVHSENTLAGDTQSPEKILMLRRISSFESMYLARSLSRMFDPINRAFPSDSISRASLSKNDVTNLMRIISSELETAKFNTDLLRAVATNVGKALNLYCVKCESMVATDSNAYQISGPCTASQNINFTLVRNLYFLQQSIWNTVEEYPEFVKQIVSEAAENARRLVSAIPEPLLAQIRRDLEGIVVKIHREDFSRQQQLSKSFLRAGSEPQCSAYMTELISRLKHVQNELLSRLSTGEETRTWVKSLAMRVLHVFLLHASIVSPLGEAGKLKLTGDMAPLEFALNQLLADHGMSLSDLDEEYKALRAFRPLLFLDGSQLIATHHTANIPLLNLLHHLVVRAPPNTLQLPHRVHAWPAGEYIRWLDDHSEREAVVIFVQSAASKVSNPREIPEWKIIEIILRQRGYEDLLPSEEEK